MALLQSFQRTSQPLRERPWMVAVWLVLASLTTSVVVSTLHWPAPKTHDEFSYLLAGDTFAQGRLTNPTHPFWQHFESFHVIQQPSYASKYPPGQGAFLALGQWLTGQPLAGVWILSALAAVATYWMLLGWTNPRWAALGSALYLAHPGIQLMWGQSYWGGTLAYLGGALVFGAALRLRLRARALDAIAMAIGAALLAVSRPYEGLVFCLLVGVWVTWSWLHAWRPTIGELAFKLALPQAIILGLGGFALATYHRAVTGDPLTFPYVVHEAAYAEAPMFHGQSPQVQSYRHATMKQFHDGWAMDWQRRQSTFQGWLYTKLSILWLEAEFFFPPLLAIAVLFARPWRWRRLTPVVVIAGCGVLLSLASIFSFPHYLAPMAPLLVIAVVAGLRRVEALSRLHLGERRLVPALVGLQVCLFLAAATRYALASEAGFSAQRAAIAAELRAAPGSHLVLVRYGTNHNPHEEWVYNRADIDGAKIVWARSMDAKKDARLLHFFSDRHAWLLEPESQRLTPISTTTLAQLR